MPHQSLRARATPLLATLLLLLTPLPAYAQRTHSLDDGTAELGVGLSPPGGSVFFANRFTAAPGGERLTALSIAYGLPGSGSAARPGTPVTLFVFRDANGGIHPTRPTLLATAPSEVTQAGTNTFVRVPIAPTDVAGDFFVGVLVSNIPTDGRFPISFDTTAPKSRSVAAFYFTPQSIDRLATMNYEPSRISSDPGNMDTGAFVRVIDGNFMIRAESVPVPEPTAGAALAVAALSLRRRRSC